MHKKHLNFLYILLVLIRPAADSPQRQAFILFDGIAATAIKYNSTNFHLTLVPYIFLQYNIIASFR